MRAFWQPLRTPVLPGVRPLARPLDLVLGATLFVFGFFLPFSVAGVSVMMAVLGLMVLAAAPAVWRSAPWREPVMALGLVLLAYIAVHTLWISGFTPATWHAINRYHELAMAPLLLALFRLASGRRLFFTGLICGALAYAVAHWVSLFLPRLAQYLDPRHISAGFGLALCAFVLLEQACGNRRPWLLRSAAAFLAITVLFAIEGRTGHVVLVLLVACAAWLHSAPRWKWVAVVTLPLAVIALALASTAVQNRVSETLAASSPTSGLPQSSTAIRVELLRNGLDLASRHALIGAGFTRYAEVHEQVALARYRADPARKHYVNSTWLRTSNPHNEFLMQLVGGGAVALALFLAWLGLPMLRRSANGTAHASLAGISLAFAVGCLFNSLLMDFVEGHLYVALLAWLLAQTGAAPATATAMPQPEPA